MITFQTLVIAIALGIVLAGIFLCCLVISFLVGLGFWDEVQRRRRLSRTIKHAMQYSPQDMEDILEQEGY